MLLGYIFESRPNSRALGTVGSVTTICLSINRCSYTTIDWREVPEVRDASISFPKTAILLVSTMDHYPLVESEKKISDWPIKTYSSLANDFVNQKSLVRVTSYLCTHQSDMTENR